MIARRKELTMKCYICKKRIKTAVRVFMLARNRREKDRYRDLCPNCYTAEMQRQGYELRKTSTGIDLWTKPELA